MLRVSRASLENRSFTKDCTSKRDLRFSSLIFVEEDPNRTEPGTLDELRGLRNAHVMKNCCYKKIVQRV